MVDNNLEQDKRIKWHDVLFACAGLLLLAASTFLFYMQSIRYNGGYVSDTYLYVEMSKEHHGVRLITWIFNYLYNLCGGTVGIAIYMGLVIVGIFLMNYALIRLYHGQDDIVPDNKRLYAELAALLMFYTGSMYIPYIHENVYKASWCTFAWHSPTQQLMILFALISLYLFIKIYQNYMERISPAMWIGLMVSTLISVWAKPSFMLVFIPTLIVVFIIELITHSGDGKTGKRFGRLIIFGLSMVPSGILILMLNSSIYGEGSKNSVEMGLSHLLNSGYNVGIAAICGLLFPIIVFAVNYRKFKDIRFQIALGMLLMGILEWAIFFEEGTRGEHGNFGWGRQFGCYYFFLCAMVVAIENLCDKEFLKNRKGAKIVYFAALVLTLLLHVLTQLFHFYVMGKGHSYYF